ncbi:RloB family protein [Thermoactinospora rubra]|uniref:RloB family protein n=1 Tax=Thermoactinospora rubra TaxID=1088767 RepID=UPI000A116B1B|nr:RloB family protein [Thermoactinospora rubra]
MSPRRSPQRLDRPTSRRTPKKLLLIVCEGEVTEVEYFERIRDHFRSLPVDIRSCKVVGLGRDPASVVDYAIREKDRRAREARAKGDVNIAYDEVWCVVDVDEHTTLDHALASARRAGVNLVVSLPSFELWILYHFQDYTTPCDCRTVRRQLERHIDDYDKRLSRHFPIDRHALAAERARRADPDHCRPNRRGRNPSTNVWLVVDAIRQVGKSR